MSDTKPPLNVHMYLTPVCNLACTHCYYDALPVGAVVDTLLSKDEVASAITAICDTFDADFHVEGGEVFLRDDLEAIFATLPLRYLRYVTLTTSGTVKIRVSDEYLRELGDLRISVEGDTDDIQQLVRGVSLKTALNTCRELHRRDIPFTVRITLIRQNFRRLHEMIESLCETGADRFSFYEFQAVGRGSAVESELSLNGGDVEYILDRLVSRVLPSRIHQFKLSLNSQRLSLVKRAEERLTAAGFQIIDIGGVPNLTINSNGDMGVSPWLITAHEVKDRFANLRNVDLVPELLNRLGDGSLSVSCDHTSQIMVRWKR